jgi:hypothetical protein
MANSFTGVTECVKSSALVQQIHVFLLDLANCSFFTNITLFFPLSQGEKKYTTYAF